MKAGITKYKRAVKRRIIFKEKTLAWINEIKSKSKNYLIIKIDPNVVFIYKVQNKH